MIQLLAKRFIKDYQKTSDPGVQAKYIALSGTLGLVLNLFLFLSKLVIGVMANSIAMISDSFNNLSDSLTSIIAIAGSMLSTMPADEEHPLGHGRFEYVASLLVSIVIMYVGIELLRNSVEKILHPEQVDFSLLAILILLLSIAIKLYMYRYNHQLAKQFSSGLNDGVAKDSLNDVIATGGILAAMIFTYITGLPSDGVAGVIISFLVLRTGFEFARDTVSLLLGEKPSDELIQEIEDEICKGKYVRGFHDLQIHDYGRGNVLASVHAEIPIDVTVMEIHNSIDTIERQVKQKTGVELVIHMDPSYYLNEPQYDEEKDMKTTVLDILDVSEDEEKIKLAADVIKRGGLVVMPTETVYGLAANGLDAEAIEKIFEAKNRPVDNPLILHVASIEEVRPLVKEIPPHALILMEKLWPGPLTIILEKSKVVPEILSAGGKTVAIRMPDNPIALRLIELSGVPLAAPSANISGKPSPTNAIDVYVDLNGKVDVILDGGGSRIGIESTVLDMTTDPPKILRPGYFGKNFMEDLIPRVEYDEGILDEGVTPKSPGMKYRHYAPKAELIVYSADLEDPIQKINKDAAAFQEAGLKVGIMTFAEHMVLYDVDVILNVGSSFDTEQMAKELYTKLRDFDRMGVDVILAEGVAERGLGFAIMDRLRKSSGGKVVEPQ